MVIGAIATISATTTQKSTASSKSPTLKFMPITPAMQRAREQDHGGEREHLHDLVRLVPAAGDQDVEGADDRLARVARFLHGGLEALKSD